MCTYENPPHLKQNIPALDWIMIAKFTYLKITHKANLFENGINVRDSDRNFEVTLFVEMIQEWTLQEIKLGSWYRRRDNVWPYLRPQSGDRA